MVDKDKKMMEALEAAGLEVYAVPGPAIVLKCTREEFEAWVEEHRPSEEEYARIKADADFFAKHSLNIRKGWND